MTSIKSDKKVSKHWANLKNWIKAWIENPQRMGAVLPSSHYLAEEMVSHCDINDPGIIVELGGGTGVVTTALLKKGFSPERLVVVEFSQAFAMSLRQQFPGVRVIEGNAAHLISLLAQETDPIYSVVSSLPLRSFSPFLVDVIIKQITRLLAPHGKYIQFTYSFKKTRYPALLPYRHVFSKRIWRNLPPARVEVWEV